MLQAFFLVHAVTAEKAREVAANREQAATATPAAGGVSAPAAPAPIASTTSTEAIAAGDEDTTKLLQFAGEWGIR